jgi:hypothetical protein
VIAGSTLRFNVETALMEDSEDAKAYLGEVEVLVIADIVDSP